VFSRYVWTYNLASNSTEEIKLGFERVAMSNANKYSHKGILRKKKYVGFPDILQTDLEKGIISSGFQAYLNEAEVRHWGMDNKQKAAICERVIQTIKKALWKVFEMRNNYKWFDVIDDIVSAYNNRVHSTIKISPEEARTREHNNHVKLHVSKHSEKYKLNRSKLPKLKKGDMVRMKIEKSRFEKGYT
jgi:hypothetical protein